MTTEFIKFLKDNNAHDAFTKAFQESEFNRERLMYCDPKYYITNAFVWAHTEEGSDYWRDLSDKWIDTAK